MSGTPRITSRQNPRFKATLALRDSRERRASGRLLVDGAREMTRAVTAGVKAIEAWVAIDRIRSPSAHAAMLTLDRAGAEIIEADPDLLARLAYGQRDEGIVAVLAQPDTDLMSLALPATPIIAVVEGVEKPGNLGAVLRSADGAGIDAVVVAGPVSDVWNPNAIRASLGTIFTLPLAVASTEEVLAYLRGRSIKIVAAHVDAGQRYDEEDLTGAVALVVGSEDRGLSDAWEGTDIISVSIPMRGAADSLNLSASAAVLFYEARRQRDRARS